MSAHEPYSLFPIVSCGVDWLTATCKRRGVYNELETWGYDRMLKQMAGAGAATPAKVLGFTGHRVEHGFVGLSAEYAMVQLSGPWCSPLAPEAIALSTNVSRVDFQVTVWTEGEQPHLATWTYNKLLHAEKGIGRPHAFALTVGQPDGETLTINKRISDSFARLYDKTAESKLGVPRLLWRYEVEWKRKLAQRQATRLLEQRSGPQYICTQVGAWYRKKGVQPAFNYSTTMAAPEHYIDRPSWSVLNWYRDSLSKSIATSIREHGQAATIDALGLSHLLNRGPTNG